MSDYEREILGLLRQVFTRPYQVFKIEEGLNDSGLTWNPDFGVEKGGKVMMVIKSLAPDTSLENLDMRMRDAYAIMVLNWEVGRHGGVLSTGARALIVPDEVLDQLGHEKYLKYHYAFEPFGCEIIRKSAIADLELYRDEVDR